MELTTGIEPVTSSLPRKCSTTEPRKHFPIEEILLTKNAKKKPFRRKAFYGAGDKVRTCDIQLGRLTLYQLSYARIHLNFYSIIQFKTKMVAKDGFEPSKG